MDGKITARFDFKDTRERRGKKVVDDIKSKGINELKNRPEI